MNLKEYIASGIIESYVLGLASETERSEFEAMCAQYPEVAQARNAFEEALEYRLLSEAPAPPVALRARIEEAVWQSDTSGTDSLAMEDERPVRRIGPWKWLAAASVVLLAGALYWAVDTNNRYQAARTENQRLEQQLQASQDRLTALEQDARVMQQPGLKMATLEGTANAPGAFATVYWDTTSQDVYLMINNLPQPASDKQYQLWALLDGKPLDLGVFEMRRERLLVRMKNVRDAQAFAITLEPKGGSTQPTLESMYVLGQL